MSDKHSPGPWHAHSITEGQPLRRIGCTVGPGVGGGYSSVCVALIPEASEHATADALLITAAPDLLLALIWLHDMLRMQPSDMAEQMPLALDAARAAIAKAIGGAA